MKFVDKDSRRIKKREMIEGIVNNFETIFSPLEEETIVMTDFCTKAFYIETYILAEKIIDYGTIDVPLDPEEQSEYRANREIVEDHGAFIKMKEDAKNGRTFSNLVAEFNTSFDKDNPLKIIGGQHRFIAIKEAFDSNDINHHHNVKIYFGLDNNQRLDVQLISNTNIVVSSDLLDRMFETLKGPKLRNWCQTVGLLLESQDFADKKQRSNQITVRVARSFILSFLEGEKNSKKNYEKISPEPIIAKTGRIDDLWESVHNNKKDVWSDISLIEAGKQFAKLHKKQKEHFEQKRKKNLEYANKAVNYSILASWAYNAGLLQSNEIRLKRHYSLSEIENIDPLNASALAKGRHKTDPENYRGLGTRTDKKERGRLVEVFYLQAEKGNGITKGIVDLGVKKYHAKLANIEVIEAEKKLEM
jgi:hypothetical protein